MKCKYMRTKNNYTSSDYEISFKKEDIPSNIKYNSSIDLKKVLQQLMPLGKNIHLNIGAHDEKSDVHITLTTQLFINEREVEL